MPLPAAPETFATDATLTSGSNAGQPVRSALSAGARAQGWVPGALWDGQGWNYTIGRAVDFVVWLYARYSANPGSPDFAYETPIARTVVFGPHCLVGETDGTGDPAWTLINHDFDGAGQYGWQSIDNYGLGTPPGSRLFLPISNLIPRDAVITSITASVKMGATATGTARMQLGLYSRAGSTGSMATVGEAYPSVTTTAETSITLSGLSVANNNGGNDLLITVRSRTAALTGGDADVCRRVTVQFTQPRPSFF